MRLARPLQGFLELPGNHPGQARLLARRALAAGLGGDGLGVAGERKPGLVGERA